MRIPASKTALRRGLLLLAFALCLPVFVRSQVIFSITTTQTSDTVTAEFRVKNFTDIVGFQFTITWDVTEMAFQNLHSLNLPDMSLANFGTGDVSSGILLVSWYDIDVLGVTHPACPPIFSIDFLKTGSGNIPPISITGSPTAIELIDVSGNLLPLSLGDFVPSSFEVNEQVTICEGETYFFHGNTYSQAGTYQVLTPDGTGCDSLFILTLETAPPPQADIETTVQGCAEPTTLVTFTPFGGAGAPYTVTLDGSPLDSPYIALGLADGSHSLFVEDAAGCTLEQTFTLDAPEPLWLDAGPDLEIIAGDSALISLSTNALAIASVNWEPQTGLQILPDILSVLAAPSETITYNVSLLTDNGCLLSDNLTITVLKREIAVYVPNIFSPNGDGINDEFRPFTGKGISVVDFKVFGRWGELVFESSDGKGWDGTFRGKDMTPGNFAYFLIVAWPDGKTEKLEGDVLLIR